MCWCVLKRRTETLIGRRCSARARGVSAVAGWATAVEKTGAIPLYSTSWKNIASQKVAERLGLSMFGVDFHIT